MTFSWPGSITTKNKRAQPYNRETQNIKKYKESRRFRTCGFSRFCTKNLPAIVEKHRKYIGKRAGKGYNVKERMIDKIQTIYFCFVIS